MAGKGTSKLTLFAAGLLAFAILAGCSGGTGAADARAKIWKPKPTTAAWQFQLQGKIDLSIKAPVYEVDGFDVSKKTVAQLHRKGRKVICYIDVGSWENYRADKDQFPKSVIGRKYDGYPNERWLDIRRLDDMRRLIADKFGRAARLGCQALVCDNTEAWITGTDGHGGEELSIYREAGVESLKTFAAARAEAGTTPRSLT